VLEHLLKMVVERISTGRFDSQKLALQVSEGNFFQFAEGPSFWQGLGYRLCWGSLHYWLR